MKIEERLHDAMHEYADTIEPEPGFVVPDRGALRRGADAASRAEARWLVFAGVALALVVALVAVLAVRDDSGGGTRVSTGPAGGMPSRIFAVTETGQPDDARRGDRRPGRGLRHEWTWPRERRSP